jgi:RNA polymerase sigma factor (sigma-70 family)
MSLENLYRQNKNQYLSIVKKYVKDPSYEDVLHNAFCKALIRSKSFSSKKGSMQNWFLSILMSQIWDWFRIKKKENFFVHNDFADAPYEEVSLQENIQETNFSPFHKKILFAKLVMGYTYQETAKMFEIKQSNVRQIVRRFRKDIT